MTVAIPEFWRLLGESRLLQPGHIQQLQQAFGGMKGAAASGSARTLSAWLTSEGAISSYQADVILKGQPGPFFYGDYRIHDLIRRGRLNRRFRAHHVPTGHPVLLAFLEGPVTQNPELWVRAAQVAEQARQIEHPHINRLYELTDLVSFKFVVIEDLEGESLDKIASDGNRLAVREACRVAYFAAGALAHLHSRGMIHGEVRPENLWISSRGQVKLLNVPLSRDLIAPPGQFMLSGSDPDGRLQRVADYVAPELARGGSQATMQSDLYALGCTLYQMLSGWPPFAGGTPHEKVNRHCGEAIQPLDAQGVPPQLGEVIAYLMAKDPAIRYQQATQAAQALAPFVEPAALQAPLEQPPPTLAAFRSHLEQRRASLAQQAAQPEPAPQIDVTPMISTSSTSGSAGSATPTEGVSATGASPSSTLAERASRRKSSNLNTYVGLGVAGLIILVAAVIFANRGPSYPTTDPSGSAIASGGKTLTNTGSTGKGSTGTGRIKPKDNGANGGETAIPEVVVEAREQTIPDNGRTLWASPTNGPPLELSYLPPGAQIFVSLRPAEMFVGPDGEKLLAALGPDAGVWLDRLKRTTGFELEDIQRVVIGLVANDKQLDQFDVSLVVRLRSPIDLGSLLAKWNQPKETSFEGHKYYNGSGWSYFVPSAGEGYVFAMTSPKLIRELVQLAGSTPPLSRELARMLADTDADRYFNLMFVPHYLFGDGQKAVFAGNFAQLKEPLGELLDDEKLKAALLSFHVDENFFSEFRLAGDLDLPPQEVADKFHERIDKLHEDVLGTIISTGAHPYAKDLLIRYPEMIRTLSRHTRSADANGQAVLRAYLPAEAAHNLAMGSELMLAQRPGAGPGTKVVSQPAGPETVAQKLDKKTSLSFPRDTLEVSMKILSEDIGVPIEIIGGDLQLDGITKNQSFGIDLRDKPAREILETILVNANPDKTVKLPSEEKQKLVYVIKPKEPGGPEMIFITTRAQVAKRGDKLPDAFVVK